MSSGKKCFTKNKCTFIQFMSNFRLLVERCRLTKKLTKEASFGKADTLTIGERISQLRGKEPRKSLCEKLDISIRALINYETDSRMPSASLVAKLCEIYNVTTDWLILGKAIEPTHPVDLTAKMPTAECNNKHLDNRANPPASAGTKNWASGLGSVDFKVLWDEYWNEQEARRGWLQVEVIKRFPEFLEWLESRPAPLRPPHPATLKKDEPTFHYGLPAAPPED
jgi:transcriptional regulator with XRE-family HTH domain